MESINQQSIEIQTPKRKGGARAGAGRKPFNTDPQWLTARASGLTPLHASLILSQLIDERKQWLKVFACPDERVILDALKFLVSMRDGKPAQQINVTSQSVTVSVDDIAKARAIVRELTGPHAYPNNPDGTSRDDGDNPHQLSGDSLDVLAKPLMLSGADGGKNGGEVGNGKVIE